MEDIIQLFTGISFKSIPVAALASSSDMEYSSEEQVQRALNNKSMVLVKFKPTPVKGFE